MTMTTIVIVVIVTTVTTPPMTPPTTAPILTGDPPSSPRCTSGRMREYKYANYIKWFV